VIVAGRDHAPTAHHGCAVADSPSEGARSHAPQFEHDTLFYSGEAQFIEGTAPFIEEAVAAGEPVLVAVTPIRLELLKGALGSPGESVQFVDMGMLGSNPARIIPAWRRFLQDNASDGGPVRGVGEPIWAGRSDAEMTECQRHEALLNVAFDQGQAWKLLCPYDVDVLGDDVIRAARESHPFIVQDGVRRISDVYPSAWEGWSPFDGTLPRAPEEAHELGFRWGELGDLRRSVAEAADDAMLAHERTADLVLAVNELASNSIYHGGGYGSLRTWQENNALLCEVSDRGQFADPLVGRIHPTPEQWSGRGLWLANQVCDLVQIRSGAAGSVVRLHMRLH
jgi:anti-sigma regulatory factor (Ser/Thr protein kinase)